MEVVCFDVQAFELGIVYLDALVVGVAIELAGNGQAAGRGGGGDELDTPYGVYGVTADSGWVSVGTSWSGPV